MDKCQFCGADETEIDYKFSVYECGTIWRVGEHVAQSTVCRELCDLRKWRDVVLSKVVACPTENQEMPWRLETWMFVKEIKPHDNIFFSVLAKEAFDAAVRKEMGQ